MYYGYYYYLKYDSYIYLFFYLQRKDFCVCVLPVKKVLWFKA